MDARWRNLGGGRESEGVIVPKKGEKERERERERELERVARKKPAFNVE